MASNYHVNVDGYGVTDRTFSFPKPICNLNIFVDTGVTFEISFDGGENFLTVPSGFVTVPVSPVKTVVITSDGAFSLVGTQA